MKKLLISVCLISCSIFSQAQKTELKIGYISTDELLSSMPEAQKLDAELKEYQTSLAQQGQDLIKEFNDKQTAFENDSAALSPSMKEIKKKELFELYQKAQNWNQQAQEMYQAEAQKKLNPLRTKAMDAIKAVASENKISYVMDIASLLVAPPGDDMLPLVKKKLGIKEETPAPTPKKRP